MNEVECRQAGSQAATQLRTPYEFTLNAFNWLSELLIEAYCVSAAGGGAFVAISMPETCSTRLVRPPISKSQALKDGQHMLCTQRLIRWLEGHSNAPKLTLDAGHARRLH